MQLTRPFRIVRALVCAIALSTASRSPAQTGTVTPTEVRDSLSTAVARSIPLLTASPPGLVFESNPDFPETYDLSLIGQIYLEIPQTLGKGRSSATVAYSYIPLSESDGDKIAFDAAHSAYLSYSRALCQNMDLAVTFPLTFYDFSHGSVAQDTIAGDPFTVRLKGFLPYGHAPRLVDVGLGVGVSVRTRQRAYRLDAADRVIVFPGAFLSSRRWGPFRGFVNAAFDITTFAVDQTEARWGTGIDVRLHERLAGSLALIGRHELASFEGLALEFDRFGFNRELRQVVRKRREYYDFAAGMRWVAWQDVLRRTSPALMLTTSVLVSLNDDGARAPAIPTIGFEYVF